MRNLLPPSLRLSPLQWVVAGVLVAWVVWMVVSPMVERRKRMAAIYEMSDAQWRLMVTCASKADHEEAFKKFTQSRDKVRSMLGAAAHQDVWRLTYLSLDFCEIYTLGRPATAEDGIEDFEGAWVIEPPNFSTPIPVFTNRAGLLYVPKAAQEMKSAIVNIYKPLVSIASK